MNGNNIEAQTKQAMNNLKAIVEASGIGMDDVVKTTRFISDLDNFQSFNAVHSKFFQPEHSLLAHV